MSDQRFKILWHDHGREPQCPPDPRYPQGIDIDTEPAWQKKCRAELPYPARRCGFYIVVCTVCAANVVVTTAGRPDDPRSITLPCKAPIQ